MKTTYDVTIEAGAFVDCVTVEASNKEDAAYLAMKEFRSFVSKRMFEVASITMIEEL